MELADIAAFDSELLTSLQKRPDDQLRIFETAACDALQRSVLPTSGREASVSCFSEFGFFESYRTLGCDVFDVQIALKSTQLSTALRTLTAEHVGKLLKVSGIVVSAPLRVMNNMTWKVSKKYEK